MYRGARDRQPRYYRVRDIYVVVLDYMPNGNPLDRHQQHRSSPIAQVIGTKYLSLVELVPPPGQHLNIGERIYVEQLPRGAQGPRFGERLLWQELTGIAKDNLVRVLRDIMVEKERIYTEFFNVASSINIRLHMFELLPGIGKKSLETILSERKKKPFESFKDIAQRAKISDPVKSLVDRIVLELMGGEKYYLFIEPPRDSIDAVFFKMLDYLYARVNYREPW